MGWSFGKKQSYELLTSSVLISILIFVVSFVITDLIWVSTLVTIVGFVALSIGIFPLYLPRMISYVKVNVKGVEYYKITNWYDRLRIVFKPKAFKLSRIKYSDIDDISVITAKQHLNYDINAGSSSGIMITTKESKDIFVDVSWYDTVDNPIFDRAMEFVQDCTN
ncbi:hypothetical protein [Companilactobacillus jidongensis]|uniref:hypothetical protein n=1 Tax=Companilactobacillus jidongensis TaxID=2486006 RepID=UPI000F785A25|nr:hypothetical protein [Companilactobacillus jidongensis]